MSLMKKRLGSVLGVQVGWEGGALLLELLLLELPGAALLEEP